MKFILCILLLLPVVSCGLKWGKISSVATEIGWVDDNTYRISITGYPTKCLLFSIIRRYSSKEHVLDMARDAIIDKFPEIAIVEEGKFIDKDSQLIIFNNYGTILCRGSVVEEKYSDDNSCKILYEIFSPGLKNKLNPLIR